MKDAARDGIMFQGVTGGLLCKDAGLKTGPKKNPSYQLYDGYKVATYFDTKCITYVEVHQLFELAASYPAGRASGLSLH